METEKKLDRLLYGIAFLICYSFISVTTCYSSSNLNLLGIILLFFLLIYTNIKYKIFNKKYKYIKQISIILIILAFVPPSIIHLEIPYTTDLVKFAIFPCLVSLKDEIRTHIIIKCFRFFTILLILSLIEYIIGYVSGFSIIIHSELANNILYSNSLFNLYRWNDLQYRFTSLFTEPGNLGALCGFVLAFTPFVKQYRMIIFTCVIAGLLSLSLAFYTYFFIIITYKFFLGKIRFPVFMGILLVVGIIGYYARDIIQESIILRASDIESVDNRTTEKVNNWVLNIFDQNNALFGHGNRTAYKLALTEGSQGNSGLKWFLYQYGLWTIFIYFLSLFYVYRKQRNKSISFLFGVFYILIYYYVMGGWYVPFYTLLIITTLPSDKVNNSFRLCGV